MSERGRVGTPDASCNPERLTELARSGDTRALAEITRCYSQRLLAAGRRHCRTHAEAEDAVQDALLTLHTDLPKYRGEGSFEGWLVTIVASACGRMRRGHKNDPHRHVSQHEPADIVESAEERVAQKELADRIEATLLELSVQDRTILLLAEVEEFTAAEVAERVGLSAGAVRTRLTRLRQRMRERLAPGLSEDGAKS